MSVAARLPAKVGDRESSRPRTLSASRCKYQSVEPSAPTPPGVRSICIHANRFHKGNVGPIAIFPPDSCVESRSIAKPKRRRRNRADILQVDSEITVAIQGKCSTKTMTSSKNSPPTDHCPPRSAGENRKQHPDDRPTKIECSKSLANLRPITILVIERIA